MFRYVKAIAWDFDGVLNRNIVDGRFVWSDRLETDLGIPARQFQTGIFVDAFSDVISGRIDLKHHVQAWLDTQDYQIDVETLLDYWFKKDDLKDSATCDLLDRLNVLGVTQVIATNNEHHRSSYIENQAGFGPKVSAVFSSGRIGHAKPEAAFFEHVTGSLNLEPSDLLLIDDSGTNIAAARALGWNVYHFTDDTRGELASFLGL